MIYFIQRPQDSGIKIGTTTVMTSRLQDLRGKYGKEVKVLGVMDGGLKEEKQLHHQFGPFWIEGEWFQPSKELFDFIRLHAHSWDGNDRGNNGPLVRLSPRVPLELRYVMREKAAESRETMEEWFMRVICKFLDRPDLLDKSKNQITNSP